MASKTRFDREKLINMVREIPCLWDPETKEYMDTEVTSTEWRKIGDEMDLSKRWYISQTAVMCIRYK